MGSATETNKQKEVPTKRRQQVLDNRGAAAQGNPKSRRRAKLGQVQRVMKTVKEKDTCFWKPAVADMGAAEVCRRHRVRTVTNYKSSACPMPSSPVQTEQGAGVPASRRQKQEVLCSGPLHRLRGMCSTKSQAYVLRTLEHTAHLNHHLSTTLTTSSTSQEVNDYTAGPGQGRKYLTV